MVRGSIVVWLVLAIGGYAFAADPDHRHAVAYLRVMSTAGTGSAALTEPESEGSGLLIDRKQGIIVTSQSIINSLPGSSGDIFVSWSKTATPVRATLHACAYNLCLIRISPGDVPSTDRIADNDIPELACRKMNREHLQEHVVVTGYLPGEDYRVHEVQGNVTTDDPGPESNYPASIAFVDRLVPGSPVFDDDGYAVGVFDGRQAFKPLYLLNAIFLSNNVLCENLPPRLERLVPYITGSQDRNLQQKLLQDQLPTQLPDWSGVKVWELLDLSAKDEFLANLSSAIFEGRTNDSILHDMFNSPKGIEWVRQYRTRTLYLMLAHLGGSSPNPDRVRPRYALGTVKFDGAVSEFHIVVRPPIDNWDPIKGSTAVMNELAKWRPDKFVKKEFVFSCVTADEPGLNEKLKSYRTLASVPQNFAHVLEERLHAEPSLSQYSVIPMTRETCTKIYNATDPSTDPLRLPRMERFPAFFIRPNVVEYNDSVHHLAVVVGEVSRATGSSVDLPEHSVEISDRDSWTGFAREIGAQIGTGWPWISVLEFGHVQ